MFSDSEESREEHLKNIERTLDEWTNRALDQYKRKKFCEKYPEAILQDDGCFGDEWEVIYRVWR